MHQENILDNPTKIIERTLYLADDDPDEWEFFEEALRDSGLEYKMAFSPNGNELIRKLDEAMHLPELIFLDINMPGSNGLETLVRLRKNPKTSGVPVIMYSNSDDRYTVREARGNGASLYFVKPQDFNYLRDNLPNVLAMGLAPVNDEEFLYRATR